MIPLSPISLLHQCLPGSSGSPGADDSLVDGTGRGNQPERVKERKVGRVESLLAQVIGPRSKSVGRFCGPILKILAGKEEMYNETKLRELRLRLRCGAFTLHRRQ